MKRTVFATICAALAAATLVGQSEVEKNPQTEPAKNPLVTGEVTGRVIDEDTGKPRAKFSIAVARFLYRFGRPRSEGIATAVTDSEGRFRVTGLAPGNYLAVVAPETITSGEISTGFSQKEANAIDQDYETSYWPGGGGLETAAPVPLSPAGISYLGTVKLRKKSLYRVHVSIPAEVCSPGEIVLVKQAMPEVLISRGGLKRVPCGKDFLIHRFQPGRYSLNLSTTNGRIQDTILFDVKDRNIHVNAALHPGAEIDGQVILAEGVSKLPLDRLRVGSLSTVSFLDITPPVTPDAEGRFRLANLSLGPHRLELKETETSHYIKEIRYNETALSNRTFDVNGRGSLQIVIDDKPAIINGAVSEGDHPVVKPYILLSKWPPESDFVHVEPKGISGSEDGKFQFAGLAPGEYRIFAVSQTDRSKLDEPGVMERLLPGAEKISLDPRTSQSVTLKLTDPAR